MSREAPRTLLELLISREPFTWVELEDRFNRLARERARETGERATSITWNQLQRIAAGKVTNPRPATARVLETMFGRPVAELVAPAEIDDDGDMHRRDLLATAGGLALGGALAGLDPVRRQLDAAMGGPITEHDAAEWERAVDEYSHLVGAVPADQLLPELLTDLDDARAHLDRAPDGLKPRLARSCALFGGLTAVSLVGAGQWTEAGRFWRLADRAARLSGDRTVSSLIAGRRSILAIYAPGSSTAAVMSLADDALGWGDGAATSGTASAVAARAQVLAMKGDRRGARASLAELEALFERLNDSVRYVANTDDWGWPEARLRFVRSFVTSHVGDPKEAAIAQDAALAGYRVSNGLGAAQIRMHQAMSMIASGDPSEGARHVVGVLESINPAFRRGFVGSSAESALELIPEQAMRLPEVRQARELVASA